MNELFSNFSPEVIIATLVSSVLVPYCSELAKKLAKKLFNTENTIPALSWCLVLIVSFASAYIVSKFIFPTITFEQAKLMFLTQTLLAMGIKATSKTVIEYKNSK